MRKRWKWYVYIVKCQDDSYYTGCTWSPPDRAEQHISGPGSGYTRKHGFKEIVYIEEHEDLETARRRERQIKDWSRKKKEKLISGEWVKL
jgi:predicted GIY-YIG superfamily endonuclease